LLVDLDNFKHVNDTLGHPAGDRLLVDVARRLTSIVNKNYFLSRFGGDEFLVILEGCSDTFLVDAYAKEIIDLLSHPFILEKREVRIGCSIGITLFPDHGKEPDKLIQDADIAMYHAKGHGRNTYKYFSDEMDREINERVMLRNMLHGALKKKEFAIHYQPQICIKTGMVTGLEALLRWSPADLGPVSPDKFVSLLEEAGLITDVGRWVLGEACKRAVELQERGVSGLKMAVNISPRQFLQHDLAGDIERILGETGLAPECLEIEITENIFMEDLDLVRRALIDIKNLGVMITLDDFGTGYSSLGYLTRFPIDGIKIDKVFVRDLIKNNDSRELVTAIIALSKGLKLQTLVAEGVENDRQLRFLREAGCPTYQGHLYSQALPSQELDRLLVPISRIKSV
jgi:diguanylate cyclase (GGDEF)-like protein